MKTVRLSTADNVVTGTKELAPGEAGAQTVVPHGCKTCEMWLGMASGGKSKSEAQGLGDFEFVPSQIRAVT